MAPFVAHFYGIAELSALLRVAMLSCLFDGAMSPRSILAQKEMRFGRWMAITNGGGTLWSYSDGGPEFYHSGRLGSGDWLCKREYIPLSLVIYFVSGFAVTRVGPHAARISTFSKSIFGLSFLTLICSRTDIFVLGKLYSTTLGVLHHGRALVRRLRRLSSQT